MSEDSLNNAVDNKVEDNKPEELPPQREFGIYLREARQAAGFTTSDVAERLKLHEDMIKAMENSRVDILPAAAFTQGYIKAYAKLLKIVPDEIMRAYDTMVPNKVAALNFSTGVPAERNSGDSVVKITSYVLVVLALVMVIFWIQQSGFELAGNFSPVEEPDKVAELSETDQQQPDLYPVDMLTGEPGAAPVATDSALPELSGSKNVDSDKKSAMAGKTMSDSIVSDKKIEVKPVQKTVVTATANSVVGNKPDQNVSSASNGDDVIRLIVSSESWGEVQDADNNRLFYSLMKAGDSPAIKGHAPFKVFLGNASSVAIEINNKPVDISRYIRQNKIAHVKISAKATTQSGGSREVTNQVIDQFVPETSGTIKTE